MYFGIFTYIWVLGSILIIATRAKKLGEVTHDFFSNPREKIHIYIYMRIYIYTYILYTQVCRGPTSHSHERRNVKVMKVWYKEWKIKQEDNRGPRLSHRENNYIQTLYIIFPNVWGVEYFKKNDAIGGIGTYLMGPADQFNNKTAGLGFFNHFVLWFLMQNWFEDLFRFLRPLDLFIDFCSGVFGLVLRWQKGCLWSWILPAQKT